MPAPAGERPREGARPQRDHGKRARPARLRRPRRGAGLPGRRAAPARSTACSAHMDAAVEAISAAIAAGKRICVHGDYDVDGICATVARGARPARARRRRRVAPAEPLRRGLRRQRRDARTTRRRKVAGSSSRSTAASPRSRRCAGRASSGSTSSSPITTGPGDELPDCPIVATRPSDYPFPGALRHGRRLQARPGPPRARVRRFCGVTSTSSRFATIADVVPLVGENRSLAIAGLRTLARTQKLGLRALMKVARVDPAAVDAGKVGFRLAPRINAAGRLGHPRAALELLPDRRRRRGAPSRRSSRGAERRPAGGREQDPACGNRAGRRMARGEATSARVCRLGRRLARRRDRDRGFASRRALSTGPSS